MVCSTKLALYTAVVAAVPITRAGIVIKNEFPLGRVCVNDAVEVDWKVADWSATREDLVWIEVQNLSSGGSSTSTSSPSSPVARFDVFQYGQNNGEPSATLEVVDFVPKTLERLHSVIQCRHDGPFKTPDVRKVQILAPTGTIYSTLLCAHIMFMVGLLSIVMYWIRRYRLTSCILACTSAINTFWLCYTCG